MLERGVWRVDPGGDSCWLCKDSLKRQERNKEFHNQDGFQKKSRALYKQGTTVEWHVKGGSPITNHIQTSRPLQAPQS